MYRIVLKVIALTVLLYLFGADFAQASVSEPDSNRRSSTAVRPHKLSITTWLITGVLTGGARKLIHPDTSEFTDKVVAGTGISFYNYLSPRWAVAASFSLAWKDIPGSDWGPVRGISYSIGGLFDLYPEERTGPYVRLDLGLDKVSFHNYFGSTVDFGLHPFCELGIGLRSYTAGVTKLSFGLFLRFMPTDGYRIEDYGNRKVRFNVIYLGGDIGVSFPFKRFPL